MALKIIIGLGIVAALVGLSWANYSLSKRLGGAEASCESRIVGYKADRLELVAETDRRVRQEREALEQAFNIEIEVLTDRHSAWEAALRDELAVELERLDLQPEEESWAEQRIPSRLLP